MLNKFVNNPLLIVIVIIVLIFISVPIQKKIDDSRSKFSSIDSNYFIKSSTLKKFSLGFDEILSDIYWFRALQYMGTDDIKLANKNSEILYKYFDIITNLDPKFVNAYRYGATFLAEPNPFGLGDLDKGIQLLEKGRKNNPDNFRIPFEEGFLIYLYSKNYLKASELFKEASEKEGLSDFRRASIRGMAATSKARGGDRELSILIWEDIYNNTSNEGRKNFALQNLNELHTEGFEEELSERAEKYNEKYGNYPSNINDLLLKGYIKKIPKDHGDADYFFTKSLNEFKSTTLSKKKLDENITFLNVRLRRHKNDFGNYPDNLFELKDYIETNSFNDFPKHPLGEEYIYDPETGKVDYDKWFLE